MSTFTLAISCLTTSNLPWFMDLTFQVPMKYCSLQHRTLLLSPVTSTIGCCFCSGTVSSFLLELFLHWSPVTYRALTNLGRVFPCGSEVKASASNARDPGSIPGSGRSPGEVNGNPTPVFLPGESHGQKSLVGYSPWGRKESDTTERLHSLTDLGSSSFSVLSFCLFILFIGFSRQEYWSGLPFPSPVDHILSELYTMTRPSRVALHGMAHSFTELDKAVVHVIRLVSFLRLWLSVLWRRMRGLRKLPDGRDWLRGKLGLVLMSWEPCSVNL